MDAQTWLLVAAVLGIALIGGFTAGMTLVYVLRLRRPARAKPHVAHVQQRVPRAPEPAIFTPGRVEPSPYVRWRQP
jgi:hypothetical protein